MTIRPELEEVKAIAAGGQYKVLPVSCELLSDLCTPIQATAAPEKYLHPLLSAGIGPAEREVGPVHLSGL